MAFPRGWIDPILPLIVMFPPVPASKKRSKGVAPTLSIVLEKLMDADTAAVLSDAA